MQLDASKVLRLPRETQLDPPKVLRVPGLLTILNSEPLSPSNSHMLISLDMDVSSDISVLDCWRQPSINRKFNFQTSFEHVTCDMGSSGAQSFDGEGQRFMKCTHMHLLVLDGS